MKVCKTWDGKDLVGVWEVYRKLDGVRAIWTLEGVQSRHGKPLYNLEHLSFTDAEVWLGDFKKTIQAVRSKKFMPISQENVYQLDPPDDRLLLGACKDPKAKDIKSFLTRRKREGEDGLVLRQGEIWLKVKHEETFDVLVESIELGSGRNKDRMGALITSMGKVGIGFNDEERERKDWVGNIIEVSCLGLTADGKFRHPRYVREREDKC